MGPSPIITFSLALFACRLLRQSTPHPSPDQLAHVPPSPKSTCPPAESSIRLLCIAQVLGFLLYVAFPPCTGLQVWLQKSLVVVARFFFFFSVLCWFSVSWVISDTSDGKTCGGPLISRFTSVSQEYCIVSCLCLLVTWCVGTKQAVASSGSGS